MSDSESKRTAPSTAPAPAPPVAVPSASPKPAQDQDPKPKPAKKQKKKKPFAKRRSGADSDDEDGDEPSGGAPEVVSESSANAKAVPTSKTKKQAAGKKQVGGKAPGPQASVFPDANATTPAAWADMNDDDEGVSFEDFNRGAAVKRGGRGGMRGDRGRGRGGKPVVAAREPTQSNASAKSPELKELTEEQKARLEAKRLARKEKQKAKRAAIREAKAATSASTPTGAEDVDSSLAASTSALKLDDPKANSSNPKAASPPSAPASAPRTNPPGPAAPRTSPPRPAAFGPRPNRPFASRPNDPKMAPNAGNYWTRDQRGFDGLRGVPDFWRGRGGLRGMPRGGFRGMMRGVPPRGRGRGFAFAPPLRQHVPPAPATQTDKTEQDAPKAAPGGGANRDGKWGHDGFEAMQNEDKFRANLPIRGRGRGRGFMRGVPPLRGVAHKFAHLPTPEASPDRSGTAKLENTPTTQNTAESLIEDSGAVTIKLPGGAAAAAAVETESDRPPSQPTENPEPAKSPFPVFTPSNPSPVPFVGSDSGSMSSGYIPAGVPAPPMGVAPNEFYGMPGAPPSFRPSPNGGHGAPGFYPANYRPQSFTPEPAFHPHHQQRGSFSGAPGGAGFFPGGAGGRPRPASPLNPYGAQMGGFFVPARPMQKVSIRSPTLQNAGAGADEAAAASPLSDGTHSHGGDFVPRFYGQYDPTGAYGAAEAAAANNQEMYYAHAQQGYWPQAYDGDYGGYGGEVMYHNY